MRTARGSAGETRFAVIGDYGVESDSTADVARLVHGWSPDFVITTGDNNYPLGGSDTIDRNIGQYYHRFIHPYVGKYGPGAASNRFYPSLGNHDWGPEGIRPYTDYFSLPGNERYYEFRQGPVHLFAIDSDPHEPDGNTHDSSQALWLKGQLAKSDARWKIVYFHHPPYSSGAHGSSEHMQWPFAKWGADAVMAGHDHHYERLEQDGIPYYVNGVGGAGLRATRDIKDGSVVRYHDDHGAMRVSVNSTEMKLEFITRTGELVDSRIMRKGPQGRGAALWLGAQRWAGKILPRRAEH